MTITVDITRRAVLTVAAGLAAATATLGIVIAVEVDGIHEAIEAHRSIAATYDRMFEAGPGPGPYTREVSDPLAATMNERFKALSALCATVPTTDAGRRALIVYADGLLSAPDWINRLGSYRAPLQDGRDDAVRTLNPMAADIAQIIRDGYANGRTWREIAEEILAEFEES